MPAASNRADLIAITEKEWAKLTRLLDGLDPAQAMQACDGEWSIKDVLAHRAHWIGLFLGWYADGQAGRSPEIPAVGYKWNQLKVYNAHLRTTQAELGWDAARAGLEAAHGHLMALYQRLDQSALYGGPMPGGGNAWTTGRWSEASGASHYRSAAKFIRKCLRTQAGGAD